MDENIYTFRLLIFLISQHIYHNRSKLNFFLVCKAAYDVGKNQNLNQMVKIHDVSEIKKQFTNVHFEFLKLSQIILLDCELLNNISCLTISKTRPMFTKINEHNIKIKTLPIKLKKLHIKSNCFEFDANFVLPQTLEFLKITFSMDDLLTRLLSTLINLKKLIITYLSPYVILPPNLTYLKFLAYVSYYTLSTINKNNNLKTLIFSNYNQKYGRLASTEIFNPNIQYLSLGTAFDNFSNDKFKEIIPKNIIHLGIGSKSCIEILYEYPSLTKLTLLKLDFLFDDCVRKIPSTVTSICIKFKTTHDPTCELEKFISTIPNTVKSLSICINFNFRLPKIFPKNIIRLKIRKPSERILLTIN